MNINVLYRPAMSMAQVQLGPNEQITAESGAMVGMSTNVQMQTGMKGGMGKAIGRMFGGESFFQNTFTAQGAPGEVLLAHGLPGDIATVEVPQTGLYIQSSSYIATTPAVNVETQLGNFKTFFGGEGLFVLKATASGPGQPVIIGAFGGIHEIQCDGNLVIDNGHLVAWETTLNYKMVKSAKGFMASFLSGEGLVFQFEGQGRIWIQTRNPSEFGTKVGRMLPPV
jgi:uncharacterized protein (TIGR00266 family)